MLRKTSLFPSYYSSSSRNCITFPLNKLFFSMKISFCNLKSLSPSIQQTILFFYAFAVFSKLLMRFFRVSINVQLPYYISFVFEDPAVCKHQMEESNIKPHTIFLAKYIFNEAVDQSRCWQQELSTNTKKKISIIKFGHIEQPLSRWRKYA